MKKQGSSASKFTKKADNALKIKNSFSNFNANYLSEPYFHAYNSLL